MSHIHALELPPLSYDRYDAPTTPTVVVGYDGTAASEAALAYARRRCADTGRVVVVHASAPAASWFGAPSYRPAATGDVFDAIPPELVEGVWHECQVRRGAPARALVEAAHEWHADEIVVGARGSCAAGYGSVSRALLDCSDVPVVVVPRACGAAGR